VRASTREHVVIGDVADPAFTFRDHLRAISSHIEA
jgi:hypothetical protein